jgi:hypothetical protein
MTPAITREIIIKITGQENARGLSRYCQKKGQVQIEKIGSPTFHVGKINDEFTCHYIA